MEVPCPLIFKIVFMVVVVVVSSNAVVATPEFPAMFVMGDSIVDDGNNNNLNSLAKSNFMPYGIDFNGGPSGRFCNGKTIIDFLGELLGLPYLPAFADSSTTGGNVLRGVNYASAAAGILDETGRNLGDRYSLSQQVQNFESTLNQLRSQMDENSLSQYLAKSLVVIVLGSNDYINNYLKPSFYTSSYLYTPIDYADLLINHYTRQILTLHSLGFRKFFLADIGPLGCIPNQLATGLAPPRKCVFFVNELVKMFNTRLRSLVDQLNANHPGAIFVHGNTYRALNDILNSPINYGFSVTNRACCGMGMNQAQITCLPFSVPCVDRDQYVFWDAFHPTQAVNKILAHKAYAGSRSECYPINIQQMISNNNLSS
ncbi:unnamed protein product, partial [Vitis vinifera]